MKMKTTPWTQNADNPLIIEGCGGRISIAEVHDHSDTSAEHTYAEALAHAHLIVIAPILLARARAVLPLLALHGQNGCYPDCEGCAAIDALESAIAFAP